MTRTEELKALVDWITLTRETYPSLSLRDTLRLYINTYDEAEAEEEREWVSGHYLFPCSSVIARILYRMRNKSLEILFKSGRIYTYYDVPHEMAKRLAASDSPGGFFNTCIKGKYKCSVEEEGEDDD